MTLGRWTLARRDDGSTQIFMLLGMIAAIFLTVLAVRVAQANDMRSRAISAADATAIAAVTPLRDEAIDLALSGQNPAGLGLWAVADHTDDDPLYNQVARAYAERNNAMLAEKVHPSGALGHTMKASIRTKVCVRKKEDELTAQDRENLRLRRNLCTDAEGRVGIPKYHGTSTAIAELRLPECSIRTFADPDPGDDGVPYDYELYCDDVRMYSTRGYRANRLDVIRLFKIRLVAEEDETEYKGQVLGPPGDGFVPSGNWPVGSQCFGSEMTSERITKTMECVRDQIAKLFDPPVIGCYRPGTSGEHPLGRACDFMITAGGRLGMPSNQQEVQLGYNIANWAVANAARLRIYYVIYRQHIWNIFRSGEGWRLMEDRGSPTQNHMDHPHISVQP